MRNHIISYGMFLHMLKRTHKSNGINFKCDKFNLRSFLVTYVQLHFYLKFSSNVFLLFVFLFLIYSLLYLYVSHDAILIIIPYCMKTLE